MSDLKQQRRFLFECEAVNGSKSLCHYIADTVEAAKQQHELLYNSPKIVYAPNHYGVMHDLIADPETNCQVIEILYQIGKQSNSRDWVLSNLRAIVWQMEEVEIERRLESERRRIEKEVRGR